LIKLIFDTKEAMFNVSKSIASSAMVLKYMFEETNGTIPSPIKEINNFRKWEIGF
jgi:hypothetical protein